MDQLRIAFEIVHLDTPLFEDRPGDMKRRAPERVVEIRCQGMQGRDAGLHDGSGAFGARMEGRDQGRTSSAVAAARRREDHIALGMMSYLLDH